MEITNISSRKKIPAGSDLGVFNSLFFGVDNIRFNSMACFLFSLPFENEEIRKEFMRLDNGIQAKVIFQRLGGDLSVQKWTYFKNKKYDRYGSAYQDLLEMFFDGLGRNAHFRNTIMSLDVENLQSDEIITNPRMTLLTTEEHYSHLKELQKRIQENPAAYK